MNINWEVRLKNKTFWLAIIPAILLIVQIVARIFGFELDLSEIQQNLLDLVNAVFMVLVILGIVVDPTTSGLSDSNQAMLYSEPKEDIDFE